MPSDEEVEAAKQAVHEEQLEWDKIGITLNNLQPQNLQVHLISIKIDAMCQLLVQKGLATEDDMELAFQQVLLAQLQAIRPQLAEQLVQARQQISTPEIGLLGPNGRIIRKPR